MTTEATARGRDGRRSAEPERPPLTLSEAAAYLNVTPRFMRRLVAERRIAFHKLGHLLRFRREDLDTFFAGGRVEPAGRTALYGAPSRASSVVTSRRLPRTRRTEG